MGIEKPAVHKKDILMKSIVCIKSGYYISHLPLSLTGLGSSPLVIYYSAISGYYNSKITQGIATVNITNPLKLKVMRNVRFIFMAVKAASIYGVIYLSFSFCKWYIAAFISLFALLAMTMQKEETESKWMDYLNKI